MQLNLHFIKEANAVVREANVIHQLTWNNWFDFPFEL